MANRFKLSVSRKIKIRYENSFQDATNDIPNTAISHWLQASARRERQILFMQGAIGLVAISLLNPSFYQIISHYTEVSPITFIAALAMLIVGSYTLFLVIFYSFALSPRFLLSRQAGGRPIKVSFLPIARVISSLQDNEVGVLPTMIDPLDVYQIAETKQFFIKEFLISKNSLIRVGFISILCMVFFVLMGGLIDGLAQAVLVFITLLLVEVIGAGYRHQSQLNQLRQTQGDCFSAATEQAVNRPWGEYVYYVVSTYSDGRLIHLTKEMAALNALVKQAGSPRLKSGLMITDEHSPRNPILHELGLALSLLLANGYNALQIINRTSSDLLPQAVYPQLHKDMDYLTYIVEQLVPECAQKLEYAYKDGHSVGAHTFLQKEYKRLCEETLSHDAKVGKIRECYRQLSQDGLLNSLKTAFDRPPEPRPTESIVLDKSLATIPNKVMHQSIKEEIIPELQNLLTHAEPSLKGDIQKSIDNFEAFYNKQILAQQAARDLLERKVSINDIDNQNATSTKSIQNRLGELDFYLKELDREW